MNMYKKVSIAGAAVMALMVGLVFAASLQNYTASWGAPTAAVDGTALTAPVVYQLHVAKVSGGPYSGYGAQVSSLSELVVPSAPGTMCAMVTAISNGLESDPSNESCVTVPGLPVVPVKPAAPTGFTLK